MRRAGSRVPTSRRGVRPRRSTPRADAARPDRYPKRPPSQHELFPPTGGSSPAIVISAVVFPDPLSPTTATRAPRGRSTDSGSVTFPPGQPARNACTLRTPVLRPRTISFNVFGVGSIEYRHDACRRQPRLGQCHPPRWAVSRFPRKPTAEAVQGFPWTSVTCRWFRTA